MVNNQLSAFHVLIVDDERIIQELVLDVLNSLGFKNVTTAKSGRQAIDLISKNHFDFIITDWCMADMDGIDIVRFVRMSVGPTYATTPIIMLTGNTEAHYVVTAMNAGINGYVIKPFSANELVRRIRSIIEHPRPFVVSLGYNGPDRRHTGKSPPDGIERRVKSKNQGVMQFADKKSVYDIVFE